MPIKIPILRTSKWKTPRRRSRDTDADYDSDWRKMRAAYLAEHPLCACPDCDEGRIRLRAANVVDHIVPISEGPSRRLDWTNLRSMAKRCHDRHTRTQQNIKEGRSRNYPPASNNKNNEEGGQ